MNRAKLGKRNRQRGNSYERKLVKELNELYNITSLQTSRSESKNLDNKKIDIADPENILPFYVQAKSTQNTPSIVKINKEVGLKDKPLVIFWNAQEKREKNQISIGEYCLLPKDFFYKLIKTTLLNEIHGTM